MSATANSPGPKNPVLHWYEARVVLNKGGSDQTYYCNFLCSSVEDAQMRSVSMAAAEGGKFVSSEVKLSDKYNGAGPAAPLVALPAPAQKERTEKEKRAIRAFTLVPINTTVALYVQGKEAS